MKNDQPHGRVQQIKPNFPAGKGKEKMGNGQEVKLRNGREKTPPKFKFLVTALTRFDVI